MIMCDKFACDGNKCDEFACDDDVYVIVLLNIINEY
jgi:hypothetical protein